MSKKGKKKDKAGKKAAGEETASKAKKAGGKGKKGAKSLAPKPVKTGKGASALEVGKELIALFNAGDYAAIEEKLWSSKVVSVEGLGVSQAWHGRAAVRAKNEEWMATHTIHSAKAEGPFVGASGFSVKFSMDVEDKTNGQRMPMEEVAVYTVDRGKIVREEFMYRI
jgi:hypothetical protein